jgi:hypothetical protein
VLAALGAPQAIGALARARSDSSGFVREKAIASLRKLHPAEPAPGGGGSGRVATGLHVEVGGIGSKARHAPPQLVGKLRELIETELRHTPGLTLEGKPLSGFLIDSAITTLTRKSSEQYVEISIEVSFIVGKLPSKAMVMMTSGGATVQTPKVGFKPASEPGLQADALAGAVKGAHENLIAFLKNQPGMQQTAGRLGSR